MLVSLGARITYLLSPIIRKMYAQGNPTDNKEETSFCLSRSDACSRHAHVELE